MFCRSVQNSISFDFHLLLALPMKRTFSLSSRKDLTKFMAIRSLHDPGGPDTSSMFPRENSPANRSSTGGDPEDMPCVLIIEAALWVRDCSAGVDAGIWDNTELRSCESEADIFRPSAVTSQPE